ncbi:NAD-dependent epimerase/dehydratase family protein [Arcobacter caeni]|uniref:NAD-dependent epimerase/dehydratase domain-containing protein n=1 Tax=Arcobacter caeni TaxID=1912877 RepID=A0A363CXF3_9BACT|nr:NAD(P)-dependent oxidoreductase [Arcobacter caeni]PUE63768.1 hypothetical protein B0174_09475 [Arcobacter caeni]
MKNILITGTNGFIGKYLVENFKCSGYNLLFGTTSNTTNKNYYKFENLYVDVEKILKDISVDIIIHLASIIPNSFYEANIDLFIDNTKMMNNLSEFAIKNNINKFIYLSSFGSMVNTKQYDIKDYYTLSKITGEHICSIMEDRGIETASIRISSPFGKFNKKINVLNRFIDLALANQDINVYGSGKREQNFVSVESINQCIQKCVEEKVNGVYELVNDKNISMIDLAKLVVYITNSNSKIITQEKEDPLENTKVCNFSLHRVKNELQYKNPLTFKEELISYIEWKRKNK